MEIKQYNERRDKIKSFIVDKLIKENKSMITEVSIKYEVSCYNVNIRACVRELNESKLYAPISCYVNSYGVLTLVV